MGWRTVASALAGVCLVACSGFTAVDECRDGETAPCETVCGPGIMACEDGSWGACREEVAPACLPGGYGTCELSPDAPPGLWLCSDDCRIGPCLAMCFPGERFDCDAECGPGQARCQDDGTWRECREFIIPDCHLGDIERCEGGGVGHRRCTEECLFGPCDEESPCFEGEVAVCDLCSAQQCLADGTWGPCVRDEHAVCAPGETRECDGPCGGGVHFCADACTWSECVDFSGSCTPGQRQMCPGSLYCGIAFRICGPSCTWMDCIEVGM